MSKKVNFDFKGLKNNLIIMFLQLIKWIMILFWEYLLTFGVTVYLVPLMVSFIAGGTGITTDSSFFNIVALWLCPSLFALALLFLVTCLIGRKIYRLLTKWFGSMISNRR